MVGKSDQGKEKKETKVEASGSTKPKGKEQDKDKDAKPKTEELTEEDQKLQEELDLYVQRLTEDDASLYRPALEALRTQIRASTTSMTSVPKPLKFMRKHYDTVKKVCEKIQDVQIKRLCSDVISVLAMAMPTGRDCLHFRLEGMGEAISDWGHEYVRHLASQLGEEFRETNVITAQHEQLVKDIVKHHMAHNAEAEAVDLLMEMERLNLLGDFVDEHSQPRVCLYLLSCVPYVPDPENVELLSTALEIYERFGKRVDALRTAIMINDRRRIQDIFFGCADKLEQKQMALLLGRQQIFLDVPDTVEQAGDMTELISNSTLSQYFLQLARELDIMEAKTPDDIYKTHLEPTRAYGGGQVDSARQNLANTFVNGLVNCGFAVDKLVTEDANKWFYKNKEHGMMSAAASQGMIYRWDIDNGLTQIDKYLYANDDFIKAGTLLAVGIISSGVQHDCDPAAALLLDYVNHDKAIHRVGAILGLGLAYANSSRESVQEQILPALSDVLNDDKATPEVLGICALALGLICVGTGSQNAETAMSIWSLLETKQDAKQDLSDGNFRFLALAIGLIYLGRQDEVEVILESLQVLKPPFRDMACTLVDACAYAGTGNVLKVQKLLQICSKQLDMPKEDKPDDKSKASAKAAGELPEGWLEQAVAVLGIALISSAEDVGNQMSFRMFGHLLRYGEVWVRRAVPLALALTSASNPQLNVMETLSKFSHDADAETAYRAIFAMGVVGAGTNNARLGAMLRQLAGYHQREPNSLFLVRIAQGLTHMGKGTLTLHPYHSDRQLLCLPALAALLVTSFAFLDVKNTILGKQHYLLYCLVPAIQARMLLTFECEGESGEMKQINVPVRVGQAVDVVGQAGKPKTITGFQTHTTPVLLAYGERAELATEEYLSVSPILEGFVLLKKNPNYSPETAAKGLVDRPAKDITAILKKSPKP